jgi:hypothetical protein
MDCRAWLDEEVQPSDQNAAGSRLSSRQQTGADQSIDRRCDVAGIDKNIAIT